jgi:hypothetical protein
METGEVTWLVTVRQDGTSSRTVFCRGGVNDPENAAPQVTDAVVLAAFRRIPLPNSSVSIQPPGGRTLVNFETIYSAAADQFTESVTLLGQEVELEITPTQWTWSFGDGTTLVTDSGGQPWARGLEVSEENYVIHRYMQTDAAAPVSVDVTWSARWRTGSSNWRQVGETVTMSSPSVDLQVREAVPVLTGS